MQGWAADDGGADWYVRDNETGATAGPLPWGQLLSLAGSTRPLACWHAQRAPAGAPLSDLLAAWDAALRQQQQAQHLLLHQQQQAQQHRDWLHQMVRGEVQHQLRQQQQRPAADSERVAAGNGDDDDDVAMFDAPGVGMEQMEADAAASASPRRPRLYLVVSARGPLHSAPPLSSSARVYYA